MEVFVFRTSVKKQKSVKKLALIFATLPNLFKWNFDLEDSDKILRIESNENISQEIIGLLKKCNFECEELF